MNYRVRLFCLVFVTILSVPSCSPEAAKRKATESVGKFRVAWSNGNYHEIYTTADSAFKEGITEEEFTTFAQSMHSKVGEIRQSRLVGDHVNYSENGIMVILLYDTEFTNGKASEQLAWLIKGNQSYLFNYTLDLHE